MRKILLEIGLIGVLGVLSMSPTFAFDRNAVVQGARAVSFSNSTYNINSVNISLNAGPTFVGSADHSLPAYQTIAQITAQIEALKLQLKNLSAK